MDKYVVEITDEALTDMDGIYNYIANTLLDPENAMGSIIELQKPSSHWKVFRNDIRYLVQNRNCENIRKKVQKSGHKSCGFVYYMKWYRCGNLRCPQPREFMRELYFISYIISYVKQKYVDFLCTYAYNVFRRDACLCEVKVDGTAYFLIGGK